VRIADPGDDRSEQPRELRQFEPGETLVGGDQDLVDGVVVLKAADLVENRTDIDGAGRGGHRRTLRGVSGGASGQRSGPAGAP
jgi:hypothetical protein